MEVTSVSGYLDTGLCNNSNIRTKTLNHVIYFVYFNFGILFT